MKRIYLTQGQVTLVDDEDYEWLNQWKWYALWSPSTKSYYAVRTQVIEGRQYSFRMHRQILGLEAGDKRQGDHIHHNTLDNRRSQLRIVTNQQNNFNRHSPKGYTFNKAFGQFQAQLMVGYKNKNLGSYDTPEEARAVYLEAKKKHHTFSNDRVVIRERLKSRPRYMMKGLF